MSEVAGTGGKQENVELLPPPNKRQKKTNEQVEQQQQSCSGSDGANDSIEEQDDDSRNNESEDGMESEDYDSGDLEISIFFQHRSRLNAIMNHHSREDDDNARSAEDEDYSEEYSYYTEFSVRVQLINAASISQESYHAKEVKGNHRATCGGCHKKPSYGEQYAVDHTCGVYDAPKLCESCVIQRSEMLYVRSEDVSSFKKIQKMRSWLEDKSILGFNPYTEGGLYDKGPDEPFCLSRYNPTSKTFKEHKTALEKSKKTVVEERYNYLNNLLKKMG